MNIYDSILLILFFGLSIGIGFWQGRKNSSQSSSGTQDSGKNFFLGGKTIHWFILSLSLVATETSTLTFLGVPSLSYKGDYSFLSLAIGFILGRICSAIFLLPLYTKGNYYSIYEWIGGTFGRNSQRTLSLLFCSIRILADGVRLYAASLPLSFLLYSYFPSGWSFHEISILSLFILSTATIAYSAYGGFKAVVWTDFLQFLVYSSGGIMVLILLSQEFGSFWDLLSSASGNMGTEDFSSDKFRIFHTEIRTASGDWDPYYYLFSIPGGILLSLGSHGTDQMIVQRLLACKNLKESRYALILSGFLVFMQFSLFLAIGTYLYLAIPVAETNNSVFSEYIVNHLSSPLKGFILAGVFASSMSTLSSTLNSLTLTTEVDLGITKKISRHFTHKNLTIAWGILLFAASSLPFFLDEKSKTNIVELGLAFASLVFGAMVSLFFLKFFSSEENLRSMASSFPFILISSITMTWAIHALFTPPFTLLVGIGILSFYSTYGVVRIIRKII